MHFHLGFIKWANAEGIENRKSNGNGSSMRVSPIAYLFDDIETVEKEAKKQAIPQFPPRPGLCLHPADPGIQSQNRLSWPVPLL